MTTIPADQLVRVNPSVLSAGGSGVDVIGLVLTGNTRVPTNTVLQFPNGPAVESYFGGGSDEAIIAQGGANMGAGYFGGFDFSNKKPARILFAQYNQTDVAAYLRGGNVSALTLLQLQAISGSLNITVDGYPRNAASVNLSGASSFTSAAGIIATALNAADPTEATVTASLGATFTGSQSGTNLTASASTGKINIGDTITGTGYATGTKILSQTSGATGGDGVYVTNLSGTASAAASIALSNVLHVTAVATGDVADGQYVTGAGVTSAVVLSQIDGAAGGIGNYLINGVPQQVASESMTLTATPLTVTFDSVSGGFVVTSGIVDVTSTIAFATGSAAASLKMTQATGAVLSQGANAVTTATISAFMNNIVSLNANWVTFMTADADPDNGSGFAVKQAFAAWKNSKNNRFAYVCPDFDITVTEGVPASSSLGAALTASGDSGTALIYEAVDLNLAAFICGAAASIDFSETNGRTTFAFRTQTGLVASETDATAALNLAGDPQTEGDFGNGYNFYGAYGTANPTFIWYQRGLVTGDFRWFDSYINQIWLNSALQVAALTLQQNSKSIPYGTNAKTLIEGALADPIAAALNFGAFGPGTLAQSQIDAVNAQAGAKVADTIQTQGYYLQVKDATPAQRQSRTSPPCTFWYLDRGSVQAININSVALT